MNVQLINWQDDLSRHHLLLPYLVPALVSQVALTDQTECRIVRLSDQRFKLITDTETHINLTEADTNILNQLSEHTFFIDDTCIYDRSTYQQSFIHHYLVPVLRFYAKESGCHPKYVSEIAEQFGDASDDQLFLLLSQQYLHLSGQLFSQYRFSEYCLLLQKCLRQFVLHHADRDVYLLLFKLFEYRIEVKSRRWYRGEFTSWSRARTVNELELLCQEVLARKRSRLSLIEACQSLSDKLPDSSSLKRQLDTQLQQYHHHYRNLLHSPAEHPFMLAAKLTLLNMRLTCYQALECLLGQSGISNYLNSLLEQWRTHVMTALNYIVQHHLARQLFSVRQPDPNLNHQLQALNQSAPEPSCYSKLITALNSGPAQLSDALQAHLNHPNIASVVQHVSIVLAQQVKSLSDNSLQQWIDSGCFSILHFASGSQSNALTEALLKRLDGTAWVASIEALNDLTTLLQLNLIQNPALLNGIREHCLEALVQRGAVDELEQLAELISVPSTVFINGWQVKIDNALEDFDIETVVTLSQSTEPLTGDITFEQLGSNGLLSLTLANCLADPINHSESINASLASALHRYPKTRERLKHRLAEVCDKLLSEQEHDAAFLEDFLQHSEQVITRKELFNLMLAAQQPSHQRMRCYYYSPLLHYFNQDNHSAKQQVKAYFRTFYYDWMCRVDRELREPPCATEQLTETLPYDLMAISTEDEIKARLTITQQLANNPSCTQTMRQYMQCMVDIMSGVEARQELLSNVCQSLLCNSDSLRVAC